MCRMSFIPRQDEPNRKSYLPVEDSDRLDMLIFPGHSVSLFICLFCVGLPTVCLFVLL